MDLIQGVVKLGVHFIGHTCYTKTTKSGRYLKFIFGKQFISKLVLVWKDIIK